MRHYRQAPYARIEVAVNDVLPEARPVAAERPQPAAAAN
jgi:hypothetical protein